MGAAERVEVWIAAPRPGAGTRGRSESGAAIAGVPGSGLGDVLDAVERDRTAAMEPGRRAAFVTARALLRCVLAMRLGCAPGEVRLDARCQCGRPHGPVTVLPEGPWVSLSRNGPLVAVALRAEGPVGVDLASISAVASAPLTGLLPMTLPGGASTTAEPGERPAEELARAWVRTEATLKLLRTGLRRDPAEVRIDGSGLARIDGRRVARLSDLPPDPCLGPEVVGAVAIDGPRAAHVVLEDGSALLDRLLRPELAAQ